jgi:phage gp46-like protein
MKNALAINFNLDAGGADLVGGAALVTDEWLSVVVFTSLFTDAFAEPEDRPAESEDHGGYWGDTFHPRSLGSKLWTLRRKKITTDIISRARGFCIDAVRWLVDAEYLLAVDVTVEHSVRDRLNLLVRCTRSNGTYLDLQWELPNAA